LSGSRPPEPGQARLPEALVRRRRRFSLFWLIPVICGGIGLYLVITTLANRGPLITITFSTANGISAQQTQVEHKYVALGMVEDVKLSEDMSKVLVHVRMNRQGERVLTSNARFWVVRPRLSPGNISGLETLVSGAYIEVDPGLPGGESQTKFVGLEEPPGVRSDEPGKTYVLKAKALGSLGAGAPVFYRDVDVGEVLSYDLGDGLGPVTIKVFVRAPFDKFVHENSHFWNASGISVGVGAEGLHVELESIQALLSGGVAFETPQQATTAVAPAERQFNLYSNKAQADAAGFQRNIPMVTYFKSSVAGLARGSAVEVFGIQIGTVTDVHLVMEPGAKNVRARVAFELQPERVFPESELRQQATPLEVTDSLVRQGMRAVLESSNFLTGQKDIALEFVPNAPPATLGREGDALLLPSQGGGLDNITSSLSDIATKLDAIPFDEIGKNLNSALASLSQTIGGPDVRNALQKLSATLTDVQHLVHNTDKGMEPVLKKLPQMSADLQQALARANAALGEGGYGGNSDFQRSVSNLLDQVNDAARSIRLLVDFLDRHPEALIRGRTSQATER
jgi:paraquat-inducible protein B